MGLLVGRLLGLVLGWGDGVMGLLMRWEGWWVDGLG